MPRSRPFIQCDVFSTVPTRGNALAVVLDADDLSSEAMQAFAAWTNLAETTFVLPTTDPAADYRVRIFTPTREMPFAGHPTLGTCAAWRHAGGVPREAGSVWQECGVGLVEIDVGGDVPAFVAPPTRIEALEDEATSTIVAALGIDVGRVLGSARLDNGPIWQLLELASAADVLAVDAGRVRWPAFAPIGLIGRQEDEADSDFEVRMLAPSSGMSEDPITGSLNAAIAHWLAAAGRLTGDVVVSQGTRIGREGRVYIKPDPDVEGRVRIGGRSHVVVEGMLRL